MSLPFDPREGLIIVPTRLFGPTGDTLIRMALDTGATGSVVNWDVIVLLGYDPAVVPQRVQVLVFSATRSQPVQLWMECWAWTSSADGG